MLTHFRNILRLHQCKVSGNIKNDKQSVYKTLRQFSSAQTGNRKVLKIGVQGAGFDKGQVSEIERSLTFDVQIGIHRILP